MHRLMKGSAALAISLILGGAGAPQSPSVHDLLVANRHSLSVAGGRLGGEGADLIAQAVSEARIVAIGEDHFTREIPAFTGAICDLMGPDLSALVVEAGPIATADVAATIRRPDRVRRMTSLRTRYPNAVTFLDSRAENDLAAHCASVSNKTFRLIGVDQEFLGAAGLIIDHILAERLTPAARQAVLCLRTSEQDSAASARKSGDPAALLLMAITDEQVAAVRAALKDGGSRRAQQLFEALVESHHIYRLDSEGAWNSNLERSLLMKRQFVAQAPASGKMILKFGDNHMFKGIGPRGLRDLGNYVAELAEGEGRPSLHILVLGLKGTHATFGGYARPLGSEPFMMTDDPDYHWMKTVAPMVSPGEWAVFDLRRFRETRVADVDAEWRRVINGYDLLVVAPEFTPSGFVGDP